MGVLTTTLLALSLLAAQESSWAVVGLAGSGVWATDVERVEDGVRAALTRAKAGRLQPRAATAALLTEARQAGLVCDVVEPSCAAKLGASAGVDRVLIVSASAQPPRLRVELRAIDVATESVLTRATRDVDGAAPEEAVLDELVRALLAPTPADGALLLEDVPAGARVVVDGVARTLAPGEPLRGLAPGKHRVEVTNGDGTFTADAEIRSGETTNVRARIEAPAAPAPAVAAPAPVAAPLAPASPPAAVPADAGFPLAPVLAIGGAAALGVGVLGAGGLALALESPQEASTRSVMRVGGVALLGLATLGAVAGVAGAALLLTEDGA